MMEGKFPVFTCGPPRLETISLVQWLMLNLEHGSGFLLGVVAVRALPLDASGIHAHQPLLVAALDQLACHGASLGRQQHTEASLPTSYGAPCQGVAPPGVQLYGRQVRVAWVVLSGC